MRSADSARDILLSEEVVLKTFGMAAAWLLGAFACSAQTNLVFVVNDDSEVCTSAFNAGLGIGATIAAALFVFWMLRTIPGGGGDNE